MLTNVQRKPDKYTLGECYRLSQSDRCTEGLCPIENVPPARAIVRGAEPGSCAMIGLTQIVSTLSADLVSGSTSAFTGYTIDTDGNQTAITVSVPWATDFATTAAAIAAAFTADDDDITVTLSGANRVFTIVVAGGKRLVVTSPLTRTGTGTAQFTNVNGSSGEIRGISEKDRSGAYLLTFTGADDTVGYYAANKSMVPVIFRGDPAVQVAGDVTLGATPYVLLEDYTDSDDVVGLRGTFRGDDDGGLAPVVPFTGAVFSGVKDGGLAPISILKA